MTLATPPPVVGNREGEPWEEFEIVLVLAACPPETQNYDSGRPWVIELAELIGRSPAAVSKHLGNIWTLKNGRGLKNVGHLTEQVFERYRGRDDELLRDAGVIRARLYEQSSIPRIEVRFEGATRVDPVLEKEPRPGTRPALGPEDPQVDALERKLLEGFAEARLPPGSVIIYRRHGSVWLGVLSSAQWALLHAKEIATAFRLFFDILGDRTVVTPAAGFAMNEQRVALADRAILEKLPGFEIERLSGDERVNLALRLASAHALRSWKPKARRLSAFSSESHKAESDRVSERYGLDAGKLAEFDFSRLLYLMDKKQK